MKLRSQFSLRDLFWSVLIVAICVGWWIDHRSVVDSNLAAVQQVKHLQAILDQAQRENAMRLAERNAQQPTVTSSVNWSTTTTTDAPAQSADWSTVNDQRGQR